MTAPARTSAFGLVDVDLEGEDYAESEIRERRFGELEEVGLDGSVSLFETQDELTRGGVALRIAAVRELYARGCMAEASALASLIPLPTDDADDLIPVDEAPVEDLRDRTKMIDADASFRAQCLRKLTAADCVPRRLASPTDIAKLPIDPRSAFLLSLVDGTSSLQSILDVCAMPEEEALPLLEHLCFVGAIAV
jgi:hypothetical protein